MNTIFFFYLILLGLSLVLGYVPGSVPTDCKLRIEGSEYAGSLSKTRSGRTCQRWDSDEPHKNDFKNIFRFPERSATAAGNKCRNPDHTYKEGVWCYTTDPGTKLEQCDVEFCAMDCKFTKPGRYFIGPLNVTRSGKTCQRWDSDQYNTNNYKDSIDFPEKSASAAGNKCRNPADDYHEGVWCYTTDPNTPWEQCDVELCAMNCKFKKGGQEYAGPLTVTRSGRTCQHWNSDQPHDHKYKNSTLFPEGSASAAGNKCRNPDLTYEGVWCYTTDPKTRWELCDVKLCGYSFYDYREDNI